MAILEYEPGAAFPGVIGRTAEESAPAWPAPVRARDGAPNVVFIVLDDTGFGQLGCYGSPIETPSFDALAANGLRYSNMHTTALCSPSRSCIITGRNHHSNAMAAITELASGYPGYNGVIPFENGFLSEMLVEHGYSTFLVGKYHLTPSNQETGAGPFDRWPLGRGFQRFYGFLGGDTSQWYPDLVYDNHPVEPPRTPEEGYHLSEDLVDKAMEFISDVKQVDPAKPFYLYLCFGATHAPHHVPKEWADRYAGVFDDGWDAYRERVFARQKELGIVPADAELSRHDPDVPDWESLPPEARRLYSRFMEVFAGFLSPHRSPGRAAGRVPAHARGAGQHADHGHLRQRRQRRGRAHRDHERGAVLQQRPGAAGGEPRADRRDRRPQALQPLPVGLDVGREHAVPPVEAGDLPGRRQRSVHRLLAAADHGPGRGPHPVRAHHRHGAHGPGPAGHRAAQDDPRRHPVTPARRQLRPHAGRRRGREPPSDAVLRDAGSPGHLPRRLAGRLPVARPVVHRGGHGLRAADLGPDAIRAGRQRLGALPRGGGFRREPQRGRQTIATG